MADVTQNLNALSYYDANDVEKLLPVLYDELRRVASQKLAKEQSGQTLQATALVHEAYLRLMHSSPGQKWNSRGHFFGAAAEAMRRILVERARHKRRQKAGGELKRIEMQEIDVCQDGMNMDHLALNEALEKLQNLDYRKAELVKLRFYAGLTNSEAADALGISTATADNDWAYARCWLRLEMDQE